MNIVGKKLGLKGLQGLISQTARVFASSETFMNGNSVGYIEHMYENWREDPTSVHSSWSAYFNNINKGISPAYVEPPTLGTGVVVGPTSSVGTGPAASVKDIQDHLKIYELIIAYQLKGHEIGDFDPLSIFCEKL
jgi:2-oxoglutarate dehydrogenase E1 component